MQQNEKNRLSFLIHSTSLRFVDTGYENPEMEDSEEIEQENVQVNAGYENPEIVCLGSSCSGVFLNNNQDDIHVNGGDNGRRHLPEIICVTGGC